MALNGITTEQRRRVAQSHGIEWQSSAAEQRSSVMLATAMYDIDKEKKCKDLLSKRTA